MAGIIEVKDQGKVRIYDADNSNYVDIVVPSTVSSNRTITLPDASFTIPQADTVYTHPNHSGEVTSTADGATVIADNIVDEANLKVSNSPTNGYFLSAQSGDTGGLTWASAGGNNQPYFAATAASQSSLADNTWFKVNFTSEKVDSDGKYDASNAKFTPTVAGWYVCSIRVLFYNATDDMRSQSNVAFYKNGSNEGNNNSNSYRNGGGLFYFTTPQKSALIYLDEDDYLEGYARPNAADGSTATDGSACEFSAWKLI
jgi:hypothetical protein